MSGQAAVCGLCLKPINFDSDDYVTQVKTVVRPGRGGTLKMSRGGSPYHATCVIVVAADENPETGLHDKIILDGEPSAPAALEKIQ